MLPRVFKNTAQKGWNKEENPAVCLPTVRGCELWHALSDFNRDFGAKVLTLAEQRPSEIKREVSTRTITLSF